MSITADPIPFHEGAQVRQRLMAELERQRTRHAPSGDGEEILRAETRVTGVDGLAWLCAQKPMSRGYWSDRERTFELAGVGRADMLTGDDAIDYDQLTTALSARVSEAHGNVRYFGGMRFMNDGPGDGPWERFRAYRFVLPRFETLVRDHEMVFACNMRSGEDVEEIEAELREIRFSESTPETGPLSASSRRDLPSEQRWGELVRTVLASVDAGRYEKLVLARRTTMKFDERLDPAALLRRLAAGTRNRFHFCFQPHSDTAFIGASPERLYRRTGRQLETEAIAGTRPRGRSGDEDATLRRELLEDDKERREQAYVVDGISSSLQPLCLEMQADDEPSVLQLALGQHLVTKFRATLKEEVGDAELLRNLHPTAAVGGVPTASALDGLRRLEPFDRGWYAGPVGWVTRDAAQFAVGIRSALVDRNTLHLFAGAGIVEGSSADSEWAEVENKIGDFLALLDHHEPEACGRHQQPLG